MTPSPKAKDTENTTTNTFKKRRPRASKACLECRRRKVRCDVLAHGSPCSNCALDDETCIIAARASKRYYHGSSLVPPGSSATWLNSGSTEAPTRNPAFRRILVNCPNLKAQGPHTNRKSTRSPRLPIYRWAHVPT